MRFALTLLLALIAAYALSLYLTVAANPEVKFWREVMMRRDAEIAAIRKEQPGTPILFVTGGSSTAFSIDPQIIEQTCGQPTFNLGLPVAAGGNYIVSQALSRALPGDTLVICLEPDLLTATNQELGGSKLSFALSTLEGSPSEAAGRSTFSETPALRDYLNFCRPGSAYLSTLIARKLSGKGYRYTAADLRYHGRIETQVKDPTMVPATPGKATTLTQEGRQFLTTIKQSAAQRGILLAYSMPWHFTADESLPESRLRKRLIIADIHTIIPAIDDGYAGAASDSNWFSDSPQHLTAAGSAVRSHALGKAMAEGGKR